MNLERLEEALERFDSAYYDDKPGMVIDLRVLIQAARQWLRWGPAVEAAEEVWWCDLIGEAWRPTGTYPEGPHPCSQWTHPRDRCGWMLMISREK